MFIVFSLKNNVWLAQVQEGALSEKCLGAKISQKRSDVVFFFTIHRKYFCYQDIAEGIFQIWETRK